MHSLIAASEKYEALFDGWFKNILGISTGALALLASLMPDNQPPAPDKYFLAVCRLSFVLCILCALLASFRSIILARLNLNVQQALLNKSPETVKFKAPDGFIKPNHLMKIINVCQVIAVLSFCSAFISLAIYAFLRTVS